MLYQQGTQRIEIIVKKESDGVSSAGANEVPAEDVGEKNTTWRTALFGSESKTRIHRVIKTNVTHAYAVMRQTSGLALEYITSGLGAAHGDQAYQDRMSRTIEIAKDTTGFASSILQGATYGSWGGPIGTIAGAALAMVQTGTSLMVKYRGRERTYGYEMFKQNNSIEYNRARANLNLTTGRLR